jgi:diaminohydroxyphosphoribosylaminopyrimidine deaminase/5-amino-6-(5-phosphoribosylamino)uracil reductase
MTMPDRDAELTWRIVLAASAMADALERDGGARVFGVDEEARLRPLTDDGTDAVLAWCPGSGWQSRLPPDDPRSPLLDLYLPLCSATAARPLTVGHLGQSLDGFIATPSGDSQFVTGEDNIVHLHRLRALCDAVVVGAGTVAADNPQLTTRLVQGPNPLRVIIDRARRLEPTYRIFTDTAAPTLYICGQSRIRPGETHIGTAEIIGLDDEETGRAHAQVLSLLRARRCSRVFVEGGGVTVSAFLEANLLDRLHIAVAPLLIGEGRPAIRLAPQASLSDCRRPGYRVFRMGGDVLFDCELNAPAPAVEGSEPAAPSIARII